MDILLKAVCVCMRTHVCVCEREREFGQQFNEEHLRRITISLQDNPIRNLQYLELQDLTRVYLSTKTQWLKARGGESRSWSRQSPERIN
jgi:hypothetical protein